MFSIKGNAGEPLCRIEWFGTTSGAVLTDDQGYYEAKDVLVPGGKYSVRPYTRQDQAMEIDSADEDYHLNWPADDPSLYAPLNTLDGFHEALKNDVRALGRPLTEAERLALFDKQFKERRLADWIPALLPGIFLEGNGTLFEAYYNALVQGAEIKGSALTEEEKQAGFDAYFPAFKGCKPVGRTLNAIKSLRK
jgi:hypothetical protein